MRKTPIPMGPVQKRDIQIWSMWALAFLAHAVSRVASVEDDRMRIEERSEVVDMDGCSGSCGASPPGAFNR
jgi:hypothetical protein